MAKLSGNEIKKRARAIIAANPGGIRYAELANQIWNSDPDTPKNTIYGSIWDLDKAYPNEIAKPSRGVFTPVNVSGAIATVAPAVATVLKESDFYQSFADYLRNELDEVTEAFPLGGAGLKEKWATPDVIGTYKKRPGSVIEFPTEIVSAEIKIDPNQTIVAFGQAISYRLFSSKTYIVMPITLSEEEQSRLESLCMLFGIGLVLFELNKDEPRFSSRARAQRASPDMFYANEFAERLKKSNEPIFNKLFG